MARLTYTAFAHAMLNHLFLINLGSIVAKKVI
jgi:hypothetical protein